MPSNEINTSQLESQAEKGKPNSMNKHPTAARKSRRGSGQFTKGVSGNPSGRPPGSRNQASLLLESLLEGQAEQLTQKVIELALAGDITALRLCLERLIPPRKDRPIRLVLPPVENLQQISLAISKVATAIGEGEITPTEGEVLAAILEKHRDVMLKVDLERRIDEVERRLAEHVRTPKSEF